MTPYQSVSPGTHGKRHQPRAYIRTRGRGRIDIRLNTDTCTVLGMQSGNRYPLVVWFDPERWRMAFTLDVDHPDARMMTVSDDGIRRSLTAWCRQYGLEPRHIAGEYTVSQDPDGLWSIDLSAVPRRMTVNQRLRTVARNGARV